MKKAFLLITISVLILLSSCRREFDISSKDKTSADRLSKSSVIGTSFLPFSPLSSQNNSTSGTPVPSHSFLKSCVCIYTRFDEDREIAGSGVIYKTDGEGRAYILTNYHIIYDGNEPDDISVLFYGVNDKKSGIVAHPVGGSSLFDIALIVTEPSYFISALDYPPLQFAESLSVLDRVYAVGSPLGKGLSVTSGIISVESEYITVNSSDGNRGLSMRVVRTDAAINHGNSGGGLFDSSGMLVGLINAKDSSLSEGVAYAIPCSVVMPCAESLYKYGKVISTSLGLALYENEVYYDSSGTLSKKVYVRYTEAGGACHGIIKAGDLILYAYVDGKRVDIKNDFTLSDLALSLYGRKSISLCISRNKKIIYAEIPLYDRHFFYIA